MIHSNLIKYPNKLLRSVSEPVAIDSINNTNKETINIIKSMEKIMERSNAIGISAIQLGMPLRIIIAKDIVMINPIIIEFSQIFVKDKEGCLSIPDMFQDVNRPESIIVEWFDINEGIKRNWFNEQLARIIQHEVDHLNGVLFIDHLSKLKRDRLLHKYNKRL